MINYESIDYDSPVILHQEIQQNCYNFNHFINIMQKKF